MSAPDWILEDTAASIVTDGGPSGVQRFSARGKVRWRRRAARRVAGRIARGWRSAGTNAEASRYEASNRGRADGCASVGAHVARLRAPGRSSPAPSGYYIADAKRR